MVKQSLIAVSDGVISTETKQSLVAAMLKREIAVSFTSLIPRNDIKVNIANVVKQSLIAVSDGVIASVAKQSRFTIKHM